MDPKVSLIIPVFNAEKYLAQCLDSAIRQTLRELEIICIDDGSTDSSAEILKQYAVRDSRIRVIHQENGGPGPSAARNRGLDAAHGEFIAFMDADDWCEPEMCETAYSLAVQHNAEIAQFNFYEEENGTSRLWKKSLKETRLFTEPHERFVSIETLALTIWSRIFRRTFLVEHGIRFPEGCTWEDNYFSILAGLSAHRIVHCDAALYHYRRGVGFTQNQGWSKLFPQNANIYLHTIPIWTAILRDTEKLNLSEELRQELIYRKLKVFSHTFRKLAAPDQKAECLKMIRRALTFEDLRFLRDPGDFYLPLKIKIFYAWLFDQKGAWLGKLWLGKRPDISKKRK